MSNKTRPGNPPRRTESGAAAGSGPGRATPRLVPIRNVHPLTAITVAVVAVSLLVAPSYLRPWLEQRAAIAAEREKIATLEGEIRQMEAEKRRWDDPAYVRSQARSRLNMVMPGETAYRYMDDDAHQPIDPRSAASETSHEDPWYTRVWDSVKQAGG